MTTRGPCPEEAGPACQIIARHGFLLPQLEVALVAKRDRSAISLTKAAGSARGTASDGLSRKLGG